MNELRLLDPQELHAHEEVEEERVERLVSRIHARGVFFPPLLVDEATGVILDGHHRFEASKRLGFARIPCYCVDYLNDDNVRLESWGDDVVFTKQDVIDMGLSDSLFPLKTTRHIYDLPEDLDPVPVSTLIEGQLGAR